MNLKTELKNKRPNLSNGSLLTYNSILSSLYKNVFSKDSTNVEEIDIDKFSNTDVILQHLKGLPSNRRKTILSALVVISDKNHIVI